MVNSNERRVKDQKSEIGGQNSRSDGRCMMEDGVWGRGQDAGFQMPDTGNKRFEVRKREVNGHKTLVIGGH